VDGDADGAAAIGDRALDRLPDPPGGVGRELEAAPVVELVDGADQAQVALLDEVEQRQPAVGVLLGDGDDEAQVGLHQVVPGLDRASLHGLGQLDLLGGGQQSNLADLAQVGTNGVVERGRLFGGAIAAGLVEVQVGGQQRTVEGDFSHGLRSL